MDKDIFDGLFVLELANNHWGKLERGLKIIDDYAEVVKKNNVKASVKLQFRDVDSFIHKDFRDLEGFRYIWKTQKTQMPWASLKALVERVSEKGMLTMVTPFDEISVDKCVEFGVDIIKIASSDIRDKTLLKKIGAAGKPVIASSGGSTSLDQLDYLVKFFKEKNLPFALNHCVSLYPSEDKDLHLNQIDLLKKRYPDTVIGFSTHEYHDWDSSVKMAYAKGARTFERHVDIDYEGVPVSKYCSLPEQADIWFKAYHKAVEMCGPEESNEEKRQPPEKEVRYLDALVRGVYAKKDLPAGHKLTKEDIYLAIPLHKGQISGREFEEGEVLTASIEKDKAVNIEKLDASYSSNSDLVSLIKNRGL